VQAGWRLCRWSSGLRQGKVAGKMPAAVRKRTAGREWQQGHIAGGMVDGRGRIACLGVS